MDQQKIYPTTQQLLKHLLPTFLSREMQVSVDFCNAKDLTFIPKIKKKS